MGNFQELKVWELSKNLAIRVYKLTRCNQISRDFGFRDQIQRAAVSIPSNISEGDEMGSDKQSIHFFHIAKGSAAELLTQLIIGLEIGYIEKSEGDNLINDCKVISVMLTRLIRARSKSE